MASSSSFSLPSLQLQSPPPPPPTCSFFLQKIKSSSSSFLGQTNHLSCISSSPLHHHHHHHQQQHHLRQSSSYYYRTRRRSFGQIKKMPSTTNFCLKPTAKFNLFEIMGGRGLCNGEKNLQKELEKKPPPLHQLVVSDDEEEEITTATSSSSSSSSSTAANYYNNNTKEEENPSPAASSSPSSSSSGVLLLEVPENAFGKEMMGLTGGFPGGEEGLISFIEKNPPPPPPPSGPSRPSTTSSLLMNKSSSKPPELPILMPGMIAIVKNPKSPYYMYCGIIQRITDGRAGVLFEGGNWDKIIAFKLNELERRDKGPPMVNPKSAILESQIQNQLD